MAISRGTLRESTGAAMHAPVSPLWPRAQHNLRNLNEQLEWYSAKSSRMGQSSPHPPECSSGPAITLTHLHGCYVHEQVIALSKNQYLVKCEPLDLIESNEKGAKRGRSTTHLRQFAICSLDGVAWCSTHHTYVMDAPHVIYSSQTIHGAAMCHAHTQHTERTKRTPIAL